jgi:hypothetical protein
MKRLSNLVQFIFQIAFATILSSGQTPPASNPNAAPSHHADVAPFIGLWDGTITYNNTQGRNLTNRLVLEIKSVKGREVLIEMEEIGLAYPAMSGPGVVTPNAVSWVETEFNDGWALYRRFLGVLSTNQQINGKCFRSTLEESASFSLRKTDLEALEEFNRNNAKSLERLSAAVRNVEFLHPVWRKILPSALLWLNETLGREFRFVDESVRADLEYAINLAAALERQEGFFSKQPGCEIPLGLNRSGDASVLIGSYLISFPKNFPDGERKYPLLFDLHGSGGSLRRIHFKSIEPARETPFIIVKPITADTWQPHSLNFLLSALKSSLPIDEDRVYLRGASMGGFGVYTWAMTNPEHFAAISPICGGGDLFRARRLKNVPVWIFHGEQDDRVPFYLAETMVSALEACGANVKYSFYPEAKHNLSPFIDQTALDNWFLEHKRSDKPILSDPVDDFKLSNDGIGRKEIVTLPEQRFASMQATSDWKTRRNRQSLAPFYNVFKRAGVRPQGAIQQRILGSLTEKRRELVLPIPKGIEIKELPTDVSIVDLPATRAMSFVISTGVTDQAKEEEWIQSTLAELKERGETPTGELIKTALHTDYGIWMGTQLRFFTRIDILLK